MQYEQVETTGEDFYQFLTQGHNYTAVYNKKHFGVREKTERNWIGTQLLTFDLDNVRADVKLPRFWEACKYKPTIIYKTPTNLKEDGKGEVHARFRLIYVFDSFITDKELYQSLYDRISQGLPQNLLDPSKAMDNCGRGITQQFGGNANLRAWDDGHYFGERYVVCVSK